MKENNIVIVVPCYNEELRFHEAYFSELIKLNNSRWIFVNDGSTDKTGEILALLSSKQEIHVLKLDINQGKSEAIRKGLLFAHELYPEAAWYGYLDSDSAFDISDIKKIIGLTTQDDKLIDAYFSSRVRLNGRTVIRKTYRHLIGRLLITSFSIYWRSIPYDTQSGYKLFKANDYFFDSIKTKFKTKWFIDIEITVRMSRNKKILISIWEEPLSKWKDIGGSKITLIKVFYIIYEIMFIHYTLFRNRLMLKE